MLRRLKRTIATDVGGRIGYDTAQIFLLRTLGMGLLLLMHAVLARRLGPSGYGIVSYALSVASFAVIVTTLGLQNGVTRFGAEYLGGRRWNELKGLLVRSFQIVVLCSLIGALVIFGSSFSAIASASIRRSLLFTAAVLPVVAVAFWRTHAARSLGGITVAFVPEEVILPSLVVLAVVAGSVDQPLTAVFVYLGAGFVALVVGTVWLVRFVPGPVKRATARYRTRHWLSVSLPMAIASLTQLSLSRGDALLVGALTNMEETGRFIAISRISILVTFALRIVDSTVAPMISAAFHSGRQGDLRTIFGLGLGISFVGGLPFFLAGLIVPELVLGIFGEAYLGGTDILRVLVLGQMINAATGPIAFLLLMTGYERIYAKLIGVMALFSIVAHVMVIPSWGGLGAAWVTTGSTTVLNLALLGFGIRRILAQSSPR